MQNLIEALAEVEKIQSTIVRKQWYAEKNINCELQRGETDEATQALIEDAARRCFDIGSLFMEAGERLSTLGKIYENERQKGETK